ncbi:baseplate assembly protein [Pantoea agglomerans]|uniref:baseplate assembly protein n=1 Tax=Enterobacter agglomerans TaxID=549 RepID=UPI003DA16FA2
MSIDLSQLTQPDAIQLPDFETELAAVVALIVAAFPKAQQTAVAAALALDSEPMAALAQAYAYRSIHYAQRINEAVRAVMLASSGGNDLDQVTAGMDTERLVINEPSESSNAVYEGDTELRARALLSWSRLSTAGPSGAYRYFALSADPDVLDARAYGPETHGQAGHIFLYVLSRSGDGTASQALLDTVAAAVNGDEVRPLSDYVSVRSAEIVNYDIVADIHIPYGLDGDIVIENASEALTTYTDSVHLIGSTAARSGIDGALHQPGVITVAQAAPAADVVAAMGQAPRCASVTLNRVVIGGE